MKASTLARGRLADGRSIAYYGDYGSAPARVTADRRAIEALPATTRLVRDPLTDDWVVMAPGRRARVPAGGCPLCPTTASAASEIPASRFDVAVFDNRFPALPAPGQCEVIVYSSDHDQSLARLPLRRMRTVVGAWIDRTEQLSRRPGVAQVVCFENRGAQIGATLTHPHGQVYAYPFVPGRIDRMHATAQRRRTAGRPCVGCERATPAGSALQVTATDGWVALVPECARLPWEVHVLPRRHVSDLRDLDDAEVGELAVIYRRVLAALECVLPEPLPYMALWVQSPTGDADAVVHLHAQLFSDRFAVGAKKHLAAGELGSGAWVSEVDPAATAAYLRAAAEIRPTGAGGVLLCG